ncbi:hypothetical protein QH494_02650 [Sphingomonas sp. AR_OL41]|uniref:hypothetical protein n=1 Tax=Sphingomonas sp. AR_OL41 TaxID=3042729 RepID=UPI0024816C02|nr:hypothetical protein [Sphingomonas sp. AR_OL41]MDH7971069.1 hypothetical protein [Sphingomonas sp. AR_OL41]
MTYLEKIAEIIRQYPSLTTAGFNVRGEMNQSWEDCEDAFNACVAAITPLKRNIRPSPSAPSSYGLKHDVERLSRNNGINLYVSNGAACAALIWLGIPFVVYGPNAFAAFNLIEYRKFRNDILRVYEAHRLAA